MTKSAEEIITGNMLIAEFMQLETRAETAVLWKRYKWTNDRFYPYHRLKFHSSWDWLMPVVEKIQSNDYGYAVEITMPNKVCKIFDNGQDYCYIETFSVNNSLIEAVWLAVVDFIKFQINEKSRTDNLTQQGTE